MIFRSYLIQLIEKFNMSSGSFGSSDRSSVFICFSGRNSKPNRGFYYDKHKEINELGRWDLQKINSHDFSCYLCPVDVKHNCFGNCLVLVSTRTSN